MVEITHEFQRGDKIKVTYESVQYQGPNKNIKKKTDVGEITSKPSQKFDWERDNFDFDYTLEKGNATRSVDIDNEEVAQLMYEAGGDRDSKQWKLLEIKRV